MNITAEGVLLGVCWFLVASWLFFLLRIGMNARDVEAPGRAHLLRGYLLGIVGLALVSAFIGFVVLAIGVGAIFPSMLQVSAPLACPAGAFDVVSQSYSYKPGQSGVSRTFICTLASGEKREILWPTIAYAGLIYSALLLTVWLWLGKLGLRVIRRGSACQPGESNGQYDVRQRHELQSRLARVRAILQSKAVADKASATDDIAERLRQLQSLRDQRLISAQDYDAKKTQILAQL